MIWAIASFELRKRLTSLSTYVYLALFFACGVLSIFAAGGAFSNISAGGGSERLHADAPVMLNGLLANISYLGLLMSAAVFGQAVHQDFESHADTLLFTYPIRKFDYLSGRFLGAYLFVAWVFSTIALGMFLGAHSPVLIDHSLFAHTGVAAYLWPYVISVWPDVLFTGALFFALGALGRKMMPVYVGAVLVVLGYLIARMLLADVESLKLAALLDPFGGSALRALTRYWSVAEQNRNFIPLRGLLLANRLLWSALGFGLLGLTYLRFRMGTVGTAERHLKADDDDTLIDAVGALPAPPIERSALRAWLTLTRLGLVETVKNSYFGVLVLAAMIMALTTMSLAGKLLSTHTWPVTGQIANLGAGSFSLFILIIITFYAGEIIWRERDLNLAQLTDTLPIPTWVVYSSKLLSLCFVPVLLLGAVILAGLSFQTFQGYHHYELWLYLERLYVYSLPEYLFLCVLAFFVQSLVQNKYVGHFVMVAYYAAPPFLDKLGLEHGLFKYADTPAAPYSDMNGFGHFLKPVLIYDAYWSGLALVLAVTGSLFWTRGAEAPFRARLALAKARFTLLPRLATALGIALFLGFGAAIYYNEDILNHFRTSHEREALQAEHEKKYKQFEASPEPRIISVRTDFDLFPETETLDVRGEYQLENKTSQPISAVYIELPGDQPFTLLKLGDLPAPTESDPVQGFYTFRLRTPLPASAKTTLQFAFHFHDKGFKDEGNRKDLAANGTFFNSGNLPHLGYDRQGELEEDNTRKKYGLGPRERLPDLHDVKGLANNLLSSDADWITFDSTVSTSGDQLAVVPGTLVKRWTENCRNFFHYQQTSPMLDFYALNSARYAVRADRWEDIALEIDYHPAHTYDLDSMMQGMKDGLDYYTHHFGPYQFKQLRIVEFPDYASFAQSYPNTIPFSESIGFITRVDPNDKDAIDVPYYVTAHEVAHQWWGHQLVGGRVQGMTLLDETLAQYSALMVMKARFGERRMHRFLKYELDQYLQGRSTEQKKEVPLLRVENQQYIHYRKGSLVMYALQDYIGEDKVNQALRALLDRYAFRGPPYPSAQALYDELAKVTPPELQYLLHDLFETITFYDNRVLSADAKKLPDGRYQLELRVSAKKLQAGEQGEEKEVPMDDLIDLGALDARGDPLAVERRRLKTGTTDVTLTVDKLPEKAGIDPLRLLIDRHPDDNVMSVKVN